MTDERNGRLGERLVPAALLTVTSHASSGVLAIERTDSADLMDVRQQNGRVFVRGGPAA